MTQGVVQKIEIVGVAGTGKSTLTRALVARHPDWVVAGSIHARTFGHLPYFVHGAPGVARLLAHGARRRPFPCWDEVKMFVYASEWHRYLSAGPEHGSGTMLFDQGPLFALARLLWGGSGVTGSTWFRSWTRATAARWGIELDVVVELTAPEDVLFERINERAKPHPAKGRPALETAETLASHRRALGEVLEEVERSKSVRLLRFDTSERRVEQIVDQLSAQLSKASTPLTERVRMSNVRGGVRAPLRVTGSNDWGASGEG